MKQVTTDIFLLTSEWQDLRNQHIIRYYGVSKDHGTVELIFDNQLPVFFITREAVLPGSVRFVKRRSVDLKNFARADVDALYFETRRDLRAAAKALGESGITTFEADIRSDRRFLMERFIHSQARISGKCVKKGRLTSFRNPAISPCEVTPNLLLASLDIETGVDSGQLYSIAVHLKKNSAEFRRVFMLKPPEDGDGQASSSASNEGDATTFSQPDSFRSNQESQLLLSFKDAAGGDNSTFDPDKELFYFPSEKLLLENFTAWFKQADPDIIIGWNVVGFDLRFLEDKCQKCKVDLDLSRNGRNIYIREREYSSGYAASISGRVTLDGIELLRGAFYTFEDFTLETVAQKLLNKGKKIDFEEDKIAEIERLFKEDKRGLAAYNMEDCVLVTEIFKKTGLLELWVRRSQITGLLLSEVGRSVAAFDHMYLPRLHRKGYVAPNVADVRLENHAAGGYVMEPKPGIHDDVIVLDFKSLYPSIIQSFKIEPLSLLEKDKHPVSTPTGLQFSSSEHLLPELITNMMKQREIAKEKKDAFLSHAIKILMNSFYGVMGTSGCRFYHEKLPSAITGTGQWLLKESRKFFETRGYQVLYGDTDSVFVKLKSNEAANVDSRGPELAKMLNDFWQERLENMGVDSHLEVEFEKYYRKLVLPRARVKQGGGARKRYAGLLIKNGEEELEFIGMEYVRSDWTPLAREFQYDLYWKVLHGENIRSWINDLILRLINGELDKKLIYRKRLRKDASQYTKNISPQVRAALILEQTLKKKTRNIRYLMTRDGPEPIERRPRKLDYRHYIEKQLQPIADSILNLNGISFQSLVQPVQLSLFDDFEENES